VAIHATQGRGVMPDGTSRFRCSVEPVFHYMGTSTFANHTVLPEIALAKIRDDAPFQRGCYIGRGITKGLGVVMNRANVEEGARRMVFGLGGIGLKVIQGLPLVSADMIVRVYLNPPRRKIVEKFSTTHCFNPDELEGDLVPYLVDLTKGGADNNFECTGNVIMMRQALSCVHCGWVRSIIIGVADTGLEIATRPFRLVTGREWKGTTVGGARGRTDVPRIVACYTHGRFNIDDLITHSLPFQKITDGFELMRRGEAIRTVVAY
jgi:S-(hydroxymethyl)glutathione dehydrogenase / alcohol dehydrogenase